MAATDVQQGVGVAGAFHQRQRAREERELREGAARSYPAVRERPEADAPYRTPFQRDRDRIVYSKAFRRLKSKTQVFVAPEGDHFRTRLTHTLEVTDVSRVVARALRLNEDLVEAIGVGHDLGHPPFGHIGETVLDRCLQDRFGRRFRHNEHSLRVVDVLERSPAGLNCTAAVRDGILHHTGPVKPGSLEGAVVRLVDRIAYLNHDIDDAVRAGVLDAKDLPAEELAVLGRTESDRFDTLVGDLVEASDRAGAIVQSEQVGGAMLRLRAFMFREVYLGPAARAEHAKIERVLSTLFEHWVAEPGTLPDEGGAPGADLAARVVDYVAGMTDRFAIRAFTDLAVPREFPGSKA